MVVEENRHEVSKKNEVARGEEKTENKVDEAKVGEGDDKCNKDGKKIEVVDSDKLEGRNKHDKEVQNPEEAIESTETKMIEPMNIDSVLNQDLAHANFSGKRKNVVDESFERLFGYCWGTEFDLDEERIQNSQDARLFVKIFGPTKAARILGSISRGTKRLKTTPDMPPSSKGAIDLSSIKLPSKAQTVTETKIFAGQAIQVTRQQQNDEVYPPSKPVGGSKLDDVLAQLSGPSKLSTVQKTSDDWEQFKQSDKQLQETLEKKAQSKDAFLVKQDFLHRVDHRTFELEKDERNRERAKRGT